MEMLLKISFLLLLLIVTVRNTDSEENANLSGEEWFNRGEKLRFGENGSVVDTEEAYAALLRSANLSYLKAYFSLGMMEIFREVNGERNFSKAVDFLEQGSRLGSHSCQYLLSVLYSNGHGVPQDDSMTILLLTAAAKSGNIDANFALGFRHQFGVGVPQSCELSANYYKFVAEKVVEKVQNEGITSHSNMLRLGDGAQARQEGQKEDTTMFYRHVADLGNAEAQHWMGYRYFTGTAGMDRDIPRAVQYFEAAARQGNGAAMAALGQFYVNGTGVEANNETALKYFKNAVESGEPRGHIGLGYMYLHGNGVPEDKALAVHHFQKAVAHNLPEAQYCLAVLYYHGEGVKKDIQAAARLLTLAAAQGQILARFELGVMHLSGDGVAKDCETGLRHLKSVAEEVSDIYISSFPVVKHPVQHSGATDVVDHAHNLYMNGNYEDSLLLYTSAAEMGFPVAQQNVGYMYENGPGVGILENDHIDDDDDIERSRVGRVLHWYRRAARQGVLMANVKVGDMYFDGNTIDGEKDYEKSVEFYRKAANLRSAEANFNLGFMHEHGFGLAQDFHLAKRYYDLALTMDHNSYVPVKLALWKLSLHESYGWPFSKSSYWLSYFTSGGLSFGMDSFGLGKLDLLLIVMTIAIMVTLSLAMRARR